MNISFSKCLVALVLVSIMPATAAAESTEEVLQTAAHHGGLIVHVGCGEGKLTAALATNRRSVVQGLDTNPARVAAARRYIRLIGQYGRVSADRFDGTHLPYVDNLVTLIVAEEPGDLPMSEMMRVLSPLGIVFVKRDGKWTKTVKPWPEEIDEWQQYLHDADNNAVAHDTVVGPPRHVQWVSGPAWSRSHMTIPTVVSMVSSRGRLFTIEDTATVENPFLPGRFALVARGAFNGVMLWKIEFDEWEPVTRYIKDMAVQLQRRLAAIGETVYCTPGLDAPLTAFDAATGRMIREYPDTQRTQEFAYDGGVLYLVVGDRMNAPGYDIVKTYSGKGISLGGTDPDAPFDGTGFRGAYTRETPEKADPICAIWAIEAESGKRLWRRDDIHSYTGCSLAIRGKYAVYQTAAGTVCLNRTTGDTLWRVDKPITGGDGTMANTLILSDDMVYAKEGSSLVAYSLEDGSPKWTAPIANNCEKSADLFLAAGSVWTGGTGKPTSYDPQTGERRTIITQRMTGPMGHDRCYRNFITDRFYINSKTGGADFLTLDGKTEMPNHWVRGTCGLGVLPCNGLLYAPPYTCQCSIGAMIHGMNALYTEPGIETSNQRIRVQRSPRLVKGPAYGEVPVGTTAPLDAEDWPTYRHDPTRGGATDSKVPAALKTLWRTKLRTVPSAPVIADGKVFVAEIDAHRVCALSASDGRVLWDYTVGGRIDSPPTYHAGLLLFGSRDGWVYCVRASDGVLAWRFRDLPERRIVAHGQVESAWPVHGSVLVKDNVAYFAAGRSSFLDGGIFVYGLDPIAGKVLHTRRMYGPFDRTTGFPGTGVHGFKSDIFVADAEHLYLRHQAFESDLTAADSPGSHVIPSAGFLDDTPQHRTFWTVGSSYVNSLGSRPSGDILVTDGREFFEVRGFPLKRHSYFDPRMSGYKLVAGTVSQAARTTGSRRGKRTAVGGKSTRQPAVMKWDSNIRLTGKAMVLADQIVFVAGTPVQFPPDEPVAEYEAAYNNQRGGVLWAASALDGRKLASQELDAAPVWDGMAAAGGKLFVSLADGSVLCLGSENENKEE